MLSHRLISAAILIGSMLLLIFLDANYPLAGEPGLWLAPAMIFLSCGSAWEFSNLTHPVSKVSAWIGTFTTLLVILVSMVPLLAPILQNSNGDSQSITSSFHSFTDHSTVINWICLGLFVGLMVATVSILFSSRNSQSNPIVQWSCLSLITIYCGGLGATWVAIRLQRPPQEALLALIGISTVVKSSDAGAYFVGKGFGRTKLCPHISPGKTIEGAIGGFAIAMIVAILYFQFFLPNAFSVPPTAILWGPATLGLVLGIVGLIGDLVESMVKRAAGAKDSGTLLPGLGGIWDVTDSLLPTTIIGYLGMLAGWI